MHELSLAQNLVQMVSEALAAQGSPRVRRVVLRVGALSGTVAESLQFCHDVAARGTILEGSVLEIRTVPVAIHCAPCGRDVELPDVFRFRCPHCGTPSADIVRGREMDIESVEVEDDVAAAAASGEAT